MNNYLFLLMLLIFFNLNGDASLGRALFEAVKNNDTAEVEKLIKAGVDLSSGKVLCLALSECNNKILELLFEAGSKIDEKESLCHAIENNCTYGVKKLIDSGINVDVTLDKNDRTALHLAAARCDEIILDLLIEAHAQLNAQDTSSFTPLHVAAMKECRTVVEKLIEAGSYVNAKSATGLTPLHWAAIVCNSDIAKKLIEADALIDDQNDDGVTTFRFAASNNCIPVLQLLIQMGANLNSQTKSVLNALRTLSVDGNQSTIDAVIDSIRRYQPQYLDKAKKIIAKGQSVVVQVNLVKKIFIVAVIGIAILWIYYAPRIRDNLKFRHRMT